MCVSFYNMSSIRAREKAVSAVNAFVGIKHDFRLRMDAFGILAPETVE
jgi:hypothetical protein